MRKNKIYQIDKLNKIGYISHMEEDIVKKTFIGIVCLILCMSLFTGCGKKKEKTPNVIDETQKVLDEIEIAKKNTAARNAEGVRDTVKTYYFSLLLENGSFGKMVFTCNEYGCSTENETLDLYGNSPTSGTITINEDGTIEFKGIVIDGYNCEIPDSGEAICK